MTVWTQRSPGQRAMAAFGLVLGLMLGVLPGLMVSSVPAQAQLAPDRQFIKDIEDRKYNDIQSYIINGGNVNARDRFGTPALVIAADIQDAPVVRFLLESNANPDLYSRTSGETAMIRAAARGNSTIVQMMLAVGADVEAMDNEGETALIKAVRSNAADVVEVLLEAGADPLVADYTGRDALAYARNARDRRIRRAFENAGFKP